MCVHIQVTTINEKRGREFEKEQGGAYGRVWKEKRGKYYNIKK